MSEADKPDSFQRPVSRITIRGYKSICALENFELRPLNVLIGANGAGKSNFIGFFRMLSAIAREDLRRTVARAGGANALLFLGSEQTSMMEIGFVQGEHDYSALLKPNDVDGLVVDFDSLGPSGEPDITAIHSLTLAAPESRLKARYEEAEARRFSSAGDDALRTVYRSMQSLVTYHFHDTGDHAPPKKRCDLVDGETLRDNGANLAAFLFALRHRSPAHYKRITDTVRLVAPFFDRFNVEPLADNPQQTQLRWLQKGSSQIFQAAQLSDGTLRFIALATALGQPDPPATILLDEPELGLHPYALEVLGALIASTAYRTQLIVSTQSPALLNHVEPEDVVVVERTPDGASTFGRLQREALADWLEDYSLAELWLKNVLGGRP
jgi:predicted ATPase